MTRLVFTPFRILCIFVLAGVSIILIISTQYITPAALYGTSEIEQRNSSVNAATLIENTTVPIIDNRSSGREGGITVEEQGISEISNMSSEIATGGLSLSANSVEMPEPLPLEEEPAGAGGASPTAIPEDESVTEFPSSLLNSSDANVSSSPESASAGATKKIVSLRNFEGRDWFESRKADPPDPAVAAGPNHIVQMVNLAGQVNSKDGTLLSEFFLDKFFRAISTTGAAHSISDPIVVYDQSSGRFFASILDITDGSVRLAVSETDPTQDWKVYNIKFSQDGNLCPDQPYMAVSSDKLAIGANVASNKCGQAGQASVLGSQHLIVSKNELLSSEGKDPLLALMPIDKTGFSERPVKLTGEESDLIFASVYDGGVDSLRIIKYSGQLPDIKRLVFEVPIKQLTKPPEVQQPDTPLKIDVGGRLQSAAMSPDNKFFWLTSMDKCRPTNDVQDRACVRVIQVNASSMAVNQDFKITTKGADLVYPALAVTGSGNLILISGYSSSKLYPSLMATGQGLNSPVESVIPPTKILEGGQSHGQCSSSGPCSEVRYGDYFGASLDADPSNENRAWFSGQYMKTENAWGTHIFELGIPE